LRAAAALLSLVVGRAAVGAVEVVVLLAQLLVLVPRVAEGGGAHLTSCPLFLSPIRKTGQQVGTTFGPKRPSLVTNGLFWSRDNPTNAGDAPPSDFSVIVCISGVACSRGKALAN
jgi:hypothetical protein